MSELYSVSTRDNLPLSLVLWQFLAERERISFVAFGFETVASSAAPASAR